MNQLIDKRNLDFLKFCVRLGRVGDLYEYKFKYKIIGKVQFLRRKWKLVY